MEKLYIPLLLLNLTKNETQLLLLLFLIYESDNKKDSYDLKEIAKTVGLTLEVTLDTLNKLVVRNIVGKIVMKGIVTPELHINFDKDFLAILYDKNNPLESAKQKVKYIIECGETTFVLNPVIKSWRFTNKQTVVKILKKLKKVIPENKFVEYLLEGYNNGEKGGKRLNSIIKINNSWTVQRAVEIFKACFLKTYGNNYSPNVRDYKHMKNILVQLSTNNLKEEKLQEFITYAFEKSVQRDYVIQIAGLKYYANEFLASVNKKKKVRF